MYRPISSSKKCNQQHLRQENKDRENLVVVNVDKNASKSVKRPLSRATLFTRQTPQSVKCPSNDTKYYHPLVINKCHETTSELEIEVETVSLFDKKNEQQQPKQKVRRQDQQEQCCQYDNDDVHTTASLRDRRSFVEQVISKLIIEKSSHTCVSTKAKSPSERLLSRIGDEDWMNSTERYTYSDNQDDDNHTKQCFFISENQHNMPTKEKEQHKEQRQYHGKEMRRNQPVIHRPMDEVAADTNKGGVKREGKSHQDLQGKGKVMKKQQTDGHHFSNSIPRSTVSNSQRITHPAESITETTTDIMRKAGSSRSREQSKKEKKYKKDDDEEKKEVDFNENENNATESLQLCQKSQSCDSSPHSIKESLGQQNEKCSRGQEASKNLQRIGALWCSNKSMKFDNNNSSRIIRSSTTSNIMELDKRLEAKARGRMIGYDCEMLRRDNHHAHRSRSSSQGRQLLGKQTGSNLWNSQGRNKTALTQSGSNSKSIRSHLDDLESTILKKIKSNTMQKSPMDQRRTLTNLESIIRAKMQRNRVDSEQPTSVTVPISENNRRKDHPREKSMIDTPLEQLEELERKSRMHQFSTSNCRVATDDNHSYQSDSRSHVRSIQERYAVLNNRDSNDDETSNSFGHHCTLLQDEEIPTSSQHYYRPLCTTSQFMYDDDREGEYVRNFHLAVALPVCRNYENGNNLNKIGDSPSRIMIDPSSIPLAVEYDPTEGIMNEVQLGILQTKYKYRRLYRFLTIILIFISAALVILSVLYIEKVSITSIDLNQDTSAEEEDPSVSRNDTELRDRNNDNLVVETQPLILFFLSDVLPESMNNDRNYIPKAGIRKYLHFLFEYASTYGRNL